MKFTTQNYLYQKRVVTLIETMFITYKCVHMKLAGGERGGGREVVAEVRERVDARFSAGGRRLLYVYPTRTHLLTFLRTYLLTCLSTYLSA